MYNNKKRSYLFTSLIVESQTPQPRRWTALGGLELLFCSDDFLPQKLLVPYDLFVHKQCFLGIILTRDCHHPYHSDIIIITIIIHIKTIIITITIVIHIKTILITVLLLTNLVEILTKQAHANQNPPLLPPACANLTT